MWWWVVGGLRVNLMLGFSVGQAKQFIFTPSLSRIIGVVSLSLFWDLYFSPRRGCPRVLLHGLLTHKNIMIPPDIFGRIKFKKVALWLQNLFCAPK